MDKNIIILHIIDDNKFLSFCRETFDIDGITNNFSKSKYLTQEIEKNNFDILIVHYLTISVAKTINRLQFSQPIIWFFWGGDAFCLGKFYNKFLLDKSKKIRIKLDFKDNFTLGFKTLVKTIFPNLIDRYQPSKEILDSFEKLKLVVPVVPGDYELLKNSYTVKAPVFHLNYVNPIFRSKTASRPEGKNILLGNSASFTNNHIEIIDQISTLSLNNRKVIIPLNYGNQLYSEYICKYARKKLAGNAKCLTEFLPFEEYQVFLSSCSIVIMNHLRQQGVGNIVQSLLGGAHLYLDKTTTVFRYLNKEQFIVSEVQDIKELRDLTDHEREYNRKRCFEVFGKEKQHKKVEEMIKIVLNQHHFERIPV